MYVTLLRWSGESQLHKFTRGVYGDKRLKGKG